MKLMYDFILFFAAVVLFLIIGCILLVIKLARKDKDWFLDSDQDELTIGQSTNDHTHNHHNDRVMVVNSPTASSRSGSTINRNNTDGKDQDIENNPQYNIITNPLNYHFKALPNNVPGSAVPLRSSDHRSTQSRLIAMRYFNVKSIDEIKNHEDYFDEEEELRSIRKDGLNLDNYNHGHHDGDVDGNNLEYSNNNPNHEYLMNPPKMGSVEAEFNNDFISIFPMRQLELRPDFN